MTYRRPEVIRARIEQLMLMGIPEAVEVLVLAEKQGDPESWLTLCGLQEKFNFSLWSGDETGYADAFVKTLSLASGSYCMHVSDEDAINLPGLCDLVDVLQNEEQDAIIVDYEAINPATGKRYTVRANANRKIKVHEIWGCSHNPGIVFRVAYAKAAALELQKDRNLVPTLYRYYPHVALLIRPICMGTATFFGGFQLTQEIDEPKLHQKIDGQVFNEPIPRLMQHGDLMRRIEILKSRERDQAAAKNMKLMASKLNENFFNFLRSALSTQSTFQSRDFDLGVGKYYLRRFLMINRMSALVVRLSKPLTKKIIPK